MADLIYDDVSLSDARVGSDGVFRTTAKFSRVGVQTYFPDGKPVRRFRPPAEVKAAAERFKMAVVTKGHPADKNGNRITITADNREQFQIGFSSTPVFEDGWLKGEIAISDADGIKAAQTTHKYISDGYTANIKSESGVFVDSEGFIGEPGRFYQYDEVMTNIEGNHRAIVEHPRAGRQAVMDSIDSKGDSMPKITIGDHSMEVTQEFYDAYLKENERKLVTDSPKITTDDINREVSKRQAAFEAAKVFLGDDLQFDGAKSSTDWMKAALKAANIPFTDENVEAVFTGAVHGRSKFVQETPPSERFAFQVDSDRARQAKAPKPNDLDAKLARRLADAQVANMTAKENACI